ncbi:energy transducer TonB [Sulfuriflexus mobilis]|uniref:energy transducer TonB n=1 Tax=Sulfuriflexus mobilis TaxID=1811807 RepID=UPI000F816136|nr:TonB family protein [Sulfuriflexus mobilis]
MSPQRIGLLVSSIVHLGLLLAIFFTVTFNVPEQSSDEVLSVSLAMFASEAGPEPIPEVVTQDTAAAVVPEITEIIPGRQDSMAEKFVEKTESLSAPVAKARPAARQNQATQPNEAAEILIASTDADITYIRMLEQQYTDALKQAIEARKYYPSRARRRAHEGVAVVAFRVGREGDIKHIHVVRSSSVRILDKAAVNAVHSVGKFKPIPADIRREWWEFEVSLTYNLL